MALTVSMAEARANFRSLLDAVRGTHERVTITRHGEPEAVLISVEDLESLEETLDILGEPGALEEIRTAQAEVDRGEGIALEDVMRERGLLSAPE